MFVIYRDSCYANLKRVYIKGYRRATDGATPYLCDARGYKTRTGAQRVADGLNDNEFSSSHLWRVRSRPLRSRP